MNQPNVLQEFASLIGTIRQRQAGWRQAIEQGDRDVAAIERAIELYREAHGLGAAVTPLTDLHTATGSTLSERRRDALRMFARANQGVVVVGKSIPALVASGLFESNRKARNQVYKILGNMPDMEPVEGGLYRLIESLPDDRADAAQDDDERQPQDEQAHSMFDFPLVAVGQ